MSKVNSKVILITGAAKRVGRSLALSMAKAGMDIAFTWNNSKNEAQQLTEEILALGREVVAIQVDHSQSDAVEIIYTSFSKTFDRLDALVNNASRFDPSFIGELKAEKIDQDMIINARMPLMLIEKFTPLLAANFNPTDPSSTGRIVNFIDTHILGEPLHDYVGYNASKAALLEITKTCALELAPQITVNAIAPGVVFWASFYTEEMKKEYLQRVPLERVGQAEDVVSALKFLLLDAHYCTGQVIKLDGGRHLT